MKNVLKKGFALTLSLITLLSFFAVPAAKVSAATMYNNTSSSLAYSTVSSTGLLQTELQVTGIKGVTSRIEVELYVEKRVLGIFWKRVDIGTPDNVWTDAVNSYRYSNSFSTQLSSTGTYRVKVQFTVYGSGGSPDVIPDEDTVTY